MSDNDKALALPGTYRHMFPVRDDADLEPHHEEKVVWQLVKPGNYGPFIDVYKERPTKDTLEDDAMACISIDFFNNTLAILIWTHPHMLGDPQRIELIKDVDQWEPAQES